MDIPEKRRGDVMTEAETAALNSSIYVVNWNEKLREIIL